MIFPSCWPTVNGFSGKQEHHKADVGPRRSNGRIWPELPIRCGAPFRCFE